MELRKKLWAALAIGTLMGHVHLAVAAVSPEEAARLKSDLTPLGAERAGNPEGSIPPWDGGYTSVWPGYKSGEMRPDPFAKEKPLFQITAKNMNQYADKLSDGTKALLQRYPTFRIDVYPTHRTAAAPQWVYAKTFLNATRARLNNQVLTGAQGGIPFPIPKSGAEAIWNHLLSWKGVAFRNLYSSYTVINGKRTLVAVAELDGQVPYYYQDGPAETPSVLGLSRLNVFGPPAKVGENFVAEEPPNLRDRRLWLYQVGQRRVRRAPFVAYDTPNINSSGITLIDEASLFNGSLDRYDWKLLGKKEMFIPYNTQGFHERKIDEILTPNHINPDTVRWELHRVWVVEATLAPGKRHVLPRRRFYLDEDTWQAMTADAWDAGGQLWHIGYAMSLIMPELPGLVTHPTVVYDLRKNGYDAELLNNEMPQHVTIVPRWPETYFSPSTLAAQGIR